MPKGVYKRSPRVKKISTFTCSICGKQKDMRPSEIKQRTGKFCSRNCFFIHKKENNSKKETNCSFCLSAISIREDKVTGNNYCSLRCFSSSRRKEDAKWRDKNYIYKYMRDYNLKNKERINEKKREWRGNNKDKRLATQRMRRSAGGHISALSWERIKSTFGHKCISCGATENIEMDHIIPVSLGGRNDEDNVQPLCRKCNASKGAKCIDYRQMFIILNKS